jgi:hypothetical protein
MNQFNDFKAVKETIDSLIGNFKFSHKKLNKEISLSFVRNLEDNFLRLHPNRKKSGIFFTNPEIAQFIVKRTIFLYLNKKDPSIINSIQDFHSIKNLINSERKSLKLLNLVSKIKVCDPTCGSGIFLLTYVKVVYKIIQKLSKSESEQIIYSIFSNVYGFDLNEYFVKLSILKLLAWSLENGINPHDNQRVIERLMENILQKNSIIESHNQEYDIIIGNPPYGNILDQKEKEILKEEKIFYRDIYCSYLIKSLNWTEGIITYLVPKSFLARQSYLSFRNKFLEKSNLLEIYDLGSNLFKNATNEVQILFYEPKKLEKIHLQVYAYPDKKKVTYKEQKFDDLRACINNNCQKVSKVKRFYVYTFKEICPFCSSKTINLNRIRIKMDQKSIRIINKIEEISDLNYLNSKRFPKLIRGEEAEGLKKIKEELAKNSNGSCYFIKARSDFNYFFIQKHGPSFNIDQIDKNILKGENYEYYLKPKLLIKHNSIFPQATYTEENVSFTSSIYSLLNNSKTELKYLCGVINSMLIQYYCLYGINNQNDTTINLNQYMIRHLPFIKTSQTTKEEIARIIDKILSSLDKNNDILTDQTCSLIKNYNNIVFDLYGITEEERKQIIKELRSNIDFFHNIHN